MISILEGRIGGGKTLLSVCMILAHLAKGGTVITNVDLNLSGCAAYLLKHKGLKMDPAAITILDEEQVSNFHKYLLSGSRDLPVLVVIDEAHLWFNAKDSAVTAATKRALLTFLSQSRKLSVDLIFIVQAAENLESQFRRLAQEIWRMRDLTKIVVPVLGLKWPWPDTLAFRIDAASGMVMQRKLIRRTQDIFNCYNTNALLRPVEFAGQVSTVFQLEKIQKKRMDFNFELSNRQAFVLVLVMSILIDIILHG